MTFEEEVDQFYRAIGEAITKWQLAEHELYLIYARLIDPTNRAALSASYHTILNLNVRLSMVQAAADEVLKNRPSMKAAVTDAIDAVSNQSGTRNRIAHLVAMFDESARPGQRAFLADNTFDARNFKPGAQNNFKRYTTNEIKQAAVRFESLWEQVRRALWDLSR